MKKISVLVILALGTVWFACSNKSSSSSSQEIKIYLVALAGTDVQGKTIGCDDKLVAVTKSVNIEKTPLETSIAELLAAKDTEELKNYVKGIQLMLFQVTIAGGVGDVYLNGELTISGTCDIPRIREQLNETARQFSDLKKVNFYINTQPLEKYLNVAGQGF
jgi:hypothetical protein